MEDGLSKELAAISALVDKALDRYLPKGAGVPERLAEAMRYSVFAGGKRFRPALVIMVSDALGGRRDNAMPAACAAEMVHTYSLIHDDLPAMDDDDMRRGKPSSHKAFGEAMAILAGDALVTLAFEVVASSPRQADPARLCAELAAGAGAAGMVAGQVADIAAEGSDGDLDAVRYIHMHKTAALIRASARMGAIAAGADDGKVDLAGRYGDELGLLFQITDDILDETAESIDLGKTAGKDAAAGKLTYPKVLALEGAREAAADAARAALSILEQLGGRNTMLRGLVEYVLNRSF